MKDIRLVRYQGVWVADVVMDDEAHVCFNLCARISEQKALTINALTRPKRMRAVKRWMTYPQPIR